MREPASLLESATDHADAWSDWRWQAKHALRSAEALATRFTLTADEVRAAAQCAKDGLPVSVTPYYASLADTTDPNCPIRRQCLPVTAERVRSEGELRDPLGEETHEVAPHLVQRYPDRALLLVTDRCAVYCRFCTRSRLVGQSGGAVPLGALEPAFAWLQSHPEVSELIVSGGEPLLMSDKRIEAWVERIAALRHIQNVRIASRLPVTLPQRITPSLARLLRRLPAPWVMTHFNHPKELTPESRAACATLIDRGIPVLNHTVLLRGINDDEDTLAELFRGLVRTRAKPYYLLQGDVIAGSAHLRTPLQDGLKLMERLQGRLSGIALPKYIVDTPAGLGKVPLEPRYLLASEGGKHRLRTFRDEEVVYVDPPA